MTAFVPDKLHMERREVTLVPNPTASRDGNFAVVLGLSQNPGGTEMRERASFLAGEMQTDPSRKELPSGYPMKLP